jgi:hypothetical protein
MSTNTPDPLASALSRVLSGLTQHVDPIDGQNGTNTPAGLAADHMVRKVAASIEQAMKGFFDHQSNLPHHRHEGAPRLDAPDCPTGGEFPVDVGALKMRISELRTEAVRLLRSEHAEQRDRGRDELAVAVELFNLLIFMIEQQMQIQVERARIAR